MPHTPQAVQDAEEREPVGQAIGEQLQAGQPWAAYRRCRARPSLREYRSL